MKIESRRFTTFRVLLLAAGIGLAFLGTLLIPRAQAAPTSSERLVTIHDRGTERGVITKQDTLREVFKEVGIRLDENDRVEPGIDEKLVTNNYQVNIYRARPVLIVDGHVQQLVMSAHQTPKQIAETAGIALQDEDKAELEPSTDIIRDGASVRMIIDRAVPVQLTLYGTTETVYTQTTTVAEFMKEKGIELGAKDDMSVKPSTEIVKGMKLQIWRNGKQTVTREEKVAFDVEQIQDANREVGYRVVKTPGTEGKKIVTYEVVMKNGQEVSRKQIQMVITVQPKKQIEVVGSKPGFSGDFAAALAKLRSCEGGYDSWNPAGPYYGAYQFDRQTWEGVSSAPYGNATPAQQDAAAYALYQKRGWQPWPVCGASLPDTYR